MVHPTLRSLKRSDSLREVGDRLRRILGSMGNPAPLAGQGYLDGHAETYRHVGVVAVLLPGW